MTMYALAFRALRPSALVVLGTLSLLVGCADEESTPAGPIVRPDPVVNEQTTFDSPYVDEPVPVDVVTYFRTTDVLPDLDVRRLALVGSALYAGTASSLCRLDEQGSAFETVALGGSGAVVDLAVLGGDRLIMARADEVQVLTAAGAAGDQWPVPSGDLSAVAAVGSVVYVGSSGGLHTIDGNGVEPVAAAQGFAVRDLATVGEVLWIGTAAGVRRYDTAADSMLADLTAPEHLVDDDVRVLAATSNGVQVLAGTAGGYARIEADASAATLVAPELEGLPNGDVRALAGRDGVVLSGHGIGATALSASSKDHYHTLRWILDEQVNAVALDGEGARWIATSAGISKIHFEPMTLADRVAIHETFNERHQRMDGFVACEATYEDEWEHSGPVSLNDKDNDGLWTHMQIAAWCFAYAATGDEQFYDQARRAMDVIQLQFDVPWVTFEAQGMPPGFITRSLVRSDEGAVFEDKSTQDNWHLQEHDGQTYYWKDDTSSDEYAGHYFGIPIFYDLCAKTDEERQALADRAGTAMRYIIDQDYLLIDLDGEPTLHGHWDGLANAVDGLNECLAQGLSNCLEAYGGGGWLNSIEILGALLATWHMTGDDLFYDEYERLAMEQRYGEMIPVQETTATVTSRKLANHSDHELASVAYYTLLRYEPHPERRAIWIQSIRDMYEWEELERNALEIAVMSSAIPDPAAAAAARTLLELPTDRREWLYDNSHRLDYEVDELDRHDDGQFTRVMPYDEMRTFKWNGNPYRIAGGSSGRVVQAPWPVLLPYWMMRYYGAIE